MEEQKLRSCFDCSHQDVCKFNKFTGEQMTFIDFDSPGSRDFVSRFFELMAERCKFFLPTQNK